MTRALAFLPAVIVTVALFAAPAQAIVGGDLASPDVARSVVMLTTRKSFCSAVVVAPTLLLTAAHCVDDVGEIRVLRFTADRQPILDPVGAITTHPQYDAKAYRNRTFTIDIALVSLPAPLPSGYLAVPVPAEGEAGQMGARYLIAGFGLSVRGDGHTGGVLRAAILRGVPPASSVQLRLEQAAGASVGACQGDSGGPVLRISDGEGQATAPVLVGLLASAKGADDKRGCGGRTGVALLKPAVEWIRDHAASLGVTLAR